MAIQINLDELDGCPTYFDWLTGKCIGEGKQYIIEGIDHTELFNALVKNCAGVKPYRELLSYLLVKDFTVVEGLAVGKDDEIRAKDAMELRRTYAEEVGKEKGKSDRDIDRIWKSVHGKCSVLEFILQMAFRLDSMINEEEPGDMVSMFFEILLKNLELKETDSRDIWEEKVDRFLGRKYEPDGSGGGLFPLQNWAQSTLKDQREVSIWYQMSAWLNEHLDDEERFVE